MATLDTKKFNKDIKEKYLIKDNTFSFTPKDEFADKINTEIGDAKQPQEFLPQVKMMRWDNEVNLSVRLVHDEKKPKVTTSKEKIQWQGDKIDAIFYDKPEASEDGGYEFEVILKERPETNEVSFTLETKDLDFFYQPELTEQEIADGASRPENAIGSYAVYHQKKTGDYSADWGKNYKSGKAFHIYRPEIIDDEGNKIWGELSLDNGTLTIKIDSDWLDKAVYPVVVDPTFGYENIGTSYGYFTTARCCVGASLIHAAVTGERITGYSIYGKGLDSGDTFNVGITSYTVTGGLAGSRLVASSTVTIGNNSGIPKWWSVTGLTQTMTNGVSYGVAMAELTGTTGHQVLYYDTGAGNMVDIQTSFTLNATWTHASYSVNIWSAYASYSSGSATQPTTQILPGGGGATVGVGTYYAPISSGANIDTLSWETNLKFVTQVISAPGALSNFKVELLSAPGGSASYTFTLVKNDVDTNLTFSITGSAITGSSSNSVGVVLGDVVYLKCVGSAGANTVRPQTSLKFLSTNINESLILGHTFTNGNTYAFASGGNKFNRLINPSDKSPIYQVMPTAGYVKNLCVKLFPDDNVTTGTADVFVYKSGARSGISCTVDMAVSASANSGATSIHYDAGDTIYIQSANNSIYSDLNIGLGLTFVPDEANEFLILGGSSTILTTTITPEFHYPLPPLYNATFSGTENLRQNLSGGAFTAKKLYVLLSAAPGTSKSFTFALSDNSTPTALTCTIAADALTGSDTAHSISIADGDNLSIKKVATGTPTAGIYAKWSFVGYVTPTPSGDREVFSEVIPARATLIDPNTFARRNPEVTPGVITSTATLYDGIPKINDDPVANPAVIPLTSVLINPTVSITANPTPAVIGLTATLIDPTFLAVRNPTYTASVITSTAVLINPTATKTRNPTFPATVIPIVATLIDPGVSVGGNASPPAGVVPGILIVFQPTFLAVRNLTFPVPSVIALTSTLYDPTVTAIKNATYTVPSAFSITSILYSPTVSISDGVTAGVMLLSATVQSPDVKAGGDVTKGVGTMPLTATLYDPTVATELDGGYSPDVLTLTGTLISPVFGQGGNTYITYVSAENKLKVYVDGHISNTFQ